MLRTPTQENNEKDVDFFVDRLSEILLMQVEAADVEALTDPDLH